MTRTAEDIACAAVETLLVLLKHQKSCRQCELDDTYCATAQTYQHSVMADVRRYERAFGGSSMRVRP